MREISLKDTAEVSIIVPMYNAEKWVGQTLSSLLSQTFKDIEIILVDDGSTDNSKKIYDQFSYDRRLRYIWKKNGGTGSAINVGHENARGRHITWCSADNIYFPQFVEVLHGALSIAAQQNVQLVYSDFCFINEKGQKIRDVLHDRPQRNVDLIEGYDVGMSFMYTRELYNLTGPYWERICEDYQWVTRAAQFTNFGLIKAVLAAFRVHGGQITGSRKEEEAAAANDCKALARALYGHLGRPENTLVR